MIKNCINLILITIIIILLYLNFNTEKFDNIKDETKSIYTPLVKITKSQDFNTFGLINKIRFGIFKPNYESISYGENGLIFKSPKNYNNIIIIPGLGDCILKQDNNIVWPINCKNINKNNYTSVHLNNNSHMSTIIKLLRVLNYNDDKLKTLVYDFINFDISKILLTFKELLKNNTTIIAYDFGAVVANLCIQQLSKEEKTNINKLLLICPTIGGISLSIKEYLNGNSSMNNNITSNIDTTLLSFPNKEMNYYPVILYNSVKYYSNNISELFQKELNDEFNNEEVIRLQKESLKNPEIDTIIIGSDGFNTPVCYNYKNNLRQNPLCLEDNGDSIVPIENIKKLHNKWSYNCKLEIIKNKNHYSILKSYELCVLILKYIL